MSKSLLSQLLANGTVTPDQLTSGRRISIVVVVGIVLGLASVALQVRTPKNKMWAATLSGASYLGIAEVLLWFFFPGDFWWAKFGLAAVGIVIFGWEYKRPPVRDYLPRINLVPPKKRPIKQFFAWRRRRKGDRIRRVLQENVAPQSLTVVSAVYGRDDQLLDATQRLNTLISNGSLDFTVDNATMGGDPYVNVGKILSIEYKAGGTAFTNTFAEGTHVVLP